MGRHKERRASFIRWGTTSGRCVGCLHGLLFAILLLIATTVNAWDPQPFRRDGELSGRDFDYNERSFLNRFTYRYRPERALDWRRHPEGFRGTGGSVRNSELYIEENLRLRRTIEGPLDFLFRHELSEDFDGGYTRSLIGVRYDEGSRWSFQVLGDPVNEKEDVDIFLEALCDLGDTGYLRWALVLPDAFFNGKAQTLRYTREPYTLFAETWLTSVRGVEGGGWINWNHPLELWRVDADTVFEYQQLSGGLEISIGSEQVGMVTVEAEIEHGEREAELRDVQAAVNGVSLTRDYSLVGVRVARRLDSNVVLWGGYRELRFDEADQGYVDIRQSRDIERLDRIAYMGLNWQVNPRVLLWPGVYVAFLDNEDILIDVEGVDAVTSDNVVGKLAVPVEVSFERASVTLNATFHLDKARWGGGNIQMQVPF